jgi:hypothetical protein
VGRRRTYVANDEE